MSRIVSNKHVINILVAEDDQFQRLALLDILILCSFEVTAVENGVQARDELLKEESNYDLVLLDLMMPQMDGLELLCLMQSNDRLKDIPVIMMSSDGEMESVASCMDKGARDYLIKPIRIQSVKNIGKHIDLKKNKKSSTTQQNSFAQYEKIKMLGRGAAGCVELVRRQSDGELFALKTIQMQQMSQSERKMAENEISLLKVLVGPTIIRYYESFMENHTINIVMEYAEGGSLQDIIEEQKTINKPFEDDQIFKWMAELVLGIMVMHNKNILHRDIKTQNIFLSKDRVCKLGDFGISKALGTQADFAKTFLGTPYFMSPEVCKGQQYGQKADIWAIGCILYELVTFKRPFQNPQLSGVFDMIINKDYDPLPKETNKDIANMIYMILQKDPNRRPTVYNLAQEACIKDKLNEFLLDKNNNDKTMDDFFNVNQNQVNITEKEDNKQNSTLEAQTNTKQSLQNIELLQNKIQQVKADLNIVSVKSSFFSYEHNVFTGESFYYSVNNILKDLQSAQVKELCQEALDIGMISTVLPYNQQDSKYEKSSAFWYRFYFSRPGIQANMLNLYTAKPRNPTLIITDLMKVSQVLLNKTTNLQNEIGFISEEQIVNLTEYQDLLKYSSELQKTDLIDIKKDERMIFLLNIYQIMTLHRYMNLQMKLSGNQQEKTWKDTIMSFFNINQDKFQYNIGGLNFTCDDIFLGLLRGQNNSPNKRFKGFTNDDQRKLLICKYDSKILLHYITDEMPLLLYEYTYEGFAEELQTNFSNFISQTVYFDDIDQELHLPQTFETFQYDLGQNKQFQIQFILQHGQDIQRKKEILTGIKDGSITINYQDRKQDDY